MQSAGAIPTWLVACGLVCAAARAEAQPAEPAQLPATEAGAERPWADGVSDADQAIARELYLAGNREFAESRFAQALAKYKDAIRHWDHPAIRYNIAVCLINLDQPVEARDHLARSLAYGVAALGAEEHARGLTYRKLLDAQLGRIKITCDEPGALVTLDGKYLFTGPGDADRFLAPGEHQVVATKLGRQTASRQLTLLAGKPVAIEIRPAVELAAPIGPRWKYWRYLIGSGGLLMAIGTVIYVDARGAYADYSQEFAAQCPRGCTTQMADAIGSLRARKDGAQLEQAAAFTALSLGAVVAAAGVIGLFVDQPRARTAPAVRPVTGGAVLSIGGGF